MNTQTAVEQTATPYSGTPPEPPGEAVQRLKSERVQEGLQALARAGWALAHEEQAIETVKTFPTPEVAWLYAAFVSRFASAAGVAVTLSLAGGQVCVTVFAQGINGCAGEVDPPVLAFAHQL